MAELLNDTEITKLLGTVLIQAAKKNIKPNCYVLRMGGVGEFIQTKKEFKVGENEKKKGIKLAPGQSVTLTALETLDFRCETIAKIYPEHSLHGFLTPVTDLAREGIVASSTQVDVGYHGTLNWTLNNTSSQEKRFLFGSNLYRLAIFKLGLGEKPEQAYQGAAQGKIGLVRSSRIDSIAGMREQDWEDSRTKEGAQALLENLLQSGEPWHTLSVQFKTIDSQMKTVTNEYAQIHDQIEKLQRQLQSIEDQEKNSSDKINMQIQTGMDSVKNSLLISFSQFIAVLVGIGFWIYSNPAVQIFLKEHAFWVSLVILLTVICVAFFKREGFRKNKVH